MIDSPLPQMRIYSYASKKCIEPEISSLSNCKPIIQWALDFDRVEPAVHGHKCMYVRACTAVIDLHAMG